MDSGKLQNKGKEEASDYSSDDDALQFKPTIALSEEAKKLAHQTQTHTQVVSVAQLRAIDIYTAFEDREIADFKQKVLSAMPHELMAVYHLILINKNFFKPTHLAMLHTLNKKMTCKVEDVPVLTAILQCYIKKVISKFSYTWRDPNNMSSAHIYVNALLDKLHQLGGDKICAEALCCTLPTDQKTLDRSPLVSLIRHAHRESQFSFLACILKQRFKSLDHVPYGDLLKYCSTAKRVQVLGIVEQWFYSLKPSVEQVAVFLRDEVLHVGYSESLISYAVRYMTRRPCFEVLERNQAFKLNERLKIIEQLGELRFSLNEHQFPQQSWYDLPCLILDHPKLSLLHVVIRQGYPEFIEVLVKLGAGLEIKCEGISPLQRALFVSVPPLIKEGFSRNFHRLSRALESVKVLELLYKKQGKSDTFQQVLRTKIPHVNKYPIELMTKRGYENLLTFLVLQGAYDVLGTEIEAQLKPFLQARAYGPLGILLYQVTQDMSAEPFEKVLNTQIPSPVAPDETVALRDIFIHGVATRLIDWHDETIMLLTRIVPISFWLDENIPIYHEDPDEDGYYSEVGKMSLAQAVLNFFSDQKRLTTVALQMLEALRAHFPVKLLYVRQLINGDKNHPINFYHVACWHLSRLISCNESTLSPSNIVTFEKIIQRAQAEALNFVGSDHKNPLDTMLWSLAYRGGRNQNKHLQSATELIIKQSILLLKAGVNFSSRVWEEVAELLKLELNDRYEPLGQEMINLLLDTASRVIAEQKAAKTIELSVLRHFCQQSCQGVYEKWVHACEGTEPELIRNLKMDYHVTDSEDKEAINKFLDARLSKYMRRLKM